MADEKTAIRESFHQSDLFENQNNIKDNEEKFMLQKRHILALMGFLGFCNLYCMRTNLSVAIVAMVNNQTFGNQTQEAEFNWTPQMQGVLLSSFFWGYTITQLPGGWLASHVGGKFLYGLGVLFTGILTLLTPLAAQTHIVMLVLVRFLEGLFEGVTYPSMHTLWSKWAPPLECSKLSSFSLSGAYFGMMLSLPVSGFLAHHFGWSYIFYFFGILALVWFVFWQWLIYETPEDHPSISSKELQYLNSTIGLSFMINRTQPIPWKSLFTSLPLYAITFSHFSENWGFYTMMTELPTFLNDMLEYNLYQIGMLSAIPYLFMSLTIIVGGQLADLCRTRGLMSTGVVRKVFNCTAFMVQSFLIIVMATVMTPVAVFVCLTLSVACGGFAWSGFSANMLDIAPQYAGIIMGISNTIASIPGFIAPLVAGHIVLNHFLSEWRLVFYLVAMVYLLGAIFYGLFASGKLQPWAEPRMIEFSGKGNFGSKKQRDEEEERGGTISNDAFDDKDIR